MSDDHEIPAASLGDVDLDALRARHPREAAEIERLDALVQTGHESPAEFLRLCELLHLVGATRDAEYLLRRNLDHYDGRPLYEQLFGDEVPARFARAIAAFAAQFAVALTLDDQGDFLEETHSSLPRGRHERPAALDGPATVRFDFVERDHVTADVCSDDGESDALLRFAADRWEPSGDDDGGAASG